MSQQIVFFWTFYVSGPYRNNFQCWLLAPLCTTSCISLSSAYFTFHWLKNTHKILTSLFTNYFVLSLKELQGSPQKPHIYCEPPNFYSPPRNSLYSPPQNSLLSAAEQSLCHRTVSTLCHRTVSTLCHSLYSPPQNNLYSPPQNSLYSPPQNNLYSPPQNSLYSLPQNSLYSQPQNNQPENGFWKGFPDLVITITNISFRRQKL